MGGYKPKQHEFTAKRKEAISLQSDVVKNYVHVYKKYKDELEMIQSDNFEKISEALDLNKNPIISSMVQNLKERHKWESELAQTTPPNWLTRQRAEELRGCVQKEKDMIKSEVRHWANGIMNFDSFNHSRIYPRKEAVDDGSDREQFTEKCA